eukprot:4969763-Ditylum_brightwellii.AAC.1
MLPFFAVFFVVLKRLEDAIKSPDPDVSGKAESDMTDDVDTNAQSLTLGLITSEDVLRASALTMQLKDVCSRHLEEAALFQQVE